MDNVPPWGKWEEFQAQSAAASAAGDPVALLLAEHEWLRSIIIETDKRLDGGLDLGSEQYRQRQQVIWSIIDSHIHKEEDVVFPALDGLFAENERSDIQTETMYGEHDAIRIRFEDLQEVLDVGEDPRQAFRHLWKALTVHFDNEEQYIFEPARPLITRQFGAPLVERMTTEALAPRPAEK